MAAAEDPRVGLARQLLAAISDMDFERLGGLLAEDAVVEFPFAAGLDARGRGAIVEALRAGVTGFLDRITFEIQAAYPAEDPEVVVLEYASRGVLKAGGPYANRYVAVVRVRGGQVRLFREYFNPVSTGG